MRMGLLILFVLYCLLISIIIEDRKIFILESISSVILCPIQNSLNFILFWFNLSLLSEVNLFALFNLCLIELILHPAISKLLIIFQ